MKNPDQYMLLFSNCKVVKGLSRATICDLQTNQYFLIPEGVCHLLELCETNQISDVLRLHEDHKETILDYISFLTQQKLVYFTKELPENLTDIEHNWDYPAFISNSIIDLSIQNMAYVPDFLKEAERYGCRFFQIRVFDKEFRRENLFEVLSNLDQSTVMGIDLVFPFELGIEIDQLYPFSRLVNVTVFNALEAKNEIAGSINVNFIKKSYSPKSCGAINASYFFADIQLFTEAQKHQTCLNRKLSIDQEGYLKNCPSMAHHFGHFSNTSLQQVLDNPAFMQYWYLNVDETTKCKGCEFRYVCTGCKAFLEDPNDLNSAPMKCGYDPSTTEWSDWSNHPLKKASMKHYGFPEVVNC